MNGYVLSGTRAGWTAVASPSYLRHEMVHEINAANGYGLPAGSWPNEHVSDILAMTAPGVDHWALGSETIEGARLLPVARDLENPMLATRGEVAAAGIAYRAKHPDWPAEFFIDSHTHVIGGPFSRAAVLTANQIGRDAVHDIWYRALLDAPRTMQQWRPRFHPVLWPGATLDAARVIGRDSDDVAALRDAWHAVDLVPKRVIDGNVVKWS